MIQCDGFIYRLLVFVFTLSLQHIVDGEYQPAYLATNMVGDDDSTNTLRIVQEQTTAMSFEWSRMHHEDFAHVTLGNDIKFGFDTDVDISEGEIGLLKVIGKPCEVFNYYASGKYYWGWMTSEFQKYTMTYSRVPRIINVQFQTSSALRSYVTWQHEAAYCESSRTTYVFIGTLTQSLELFKVERNEDKFHLTDVTDVSGSRQVVILFNLLGNRFSLPSKAAMTTVKEDVTISNTTPAMTTVKEDVTISNTTPAMTTVKEDVTISNTTQTLKLLLIAFIVFVMFLCICACVYYSCRH